MPRKRYTTEELVELGRRQLNKEGWLTQSTFVRRTGVSDATIRTRFGSWMSFMDKLGVVASEPVEESEPLPPVSPLARRRERDRLKAEKARADALEARLVEVEAADEFRVGLGEIVHPRPIVAPKERGSALPAATYVACASDWHMGERVRLEETGGRNEYTPEIAEERAEQFFKSNVTMLKVAKAAWNVDTLVFWLGGDLMTGWIHEEYVAENFLSPTEEAALVLKTLKRGIDYFLEKADVARIVIPTSSGNHGRTGEKKWVAGSYRTSYEFMAYGLLAAQFANEPRVEFKLGTGYHNVLDIYGLRVRFSHGDAIKGGQGVGGIAPALYRRIGRQAEGGFGVDLDVIGHFHQLGFPRKVVMNGSLIGWNSFAEFIGAAPEPAAQASFVIDAKHRIFVTKSPGK
jgi:hypothetical protein